ncbi:hypothetical protein PFISCL1PPCAC_792, partial [Pristionchus fissidentatus]
SSSRLSLRSFLSKMVKTIFFKLEHNGVATRFSLDKEDPVDMFTYIRQEAHGVVGADLVRLFWKDGASKVRLENSFDLEEAIDYMEMKYYVSNALPCIDLEMELTSVAREKRSEKECGASFHRESLNCDECSSSLEGVQFKCAVCSNYSICKKCMEDAVHCCHSLLRITHSSLIPLTTEHGTTSLVSLSEATKMGDLTFAVKVDNEEDCEDEEEEEE